MAPTTAPVWEVDVQRRFAQRERHFDLQVRFASDARRLVLFGPSGAGKSQTLRLIAGLTAPDAGQVRLMGRTLVDRQAGIDLPARARGIALVFQDYALFPHLTVAQNIAFGLHRGWFNPRRRAEVDEAAAHWMSAFGLAALAHQRPDQLSGGQRQRAALARALAPSPSALLLDEPFAALDTALRASLRDQLADLQAQVQVPLVLITHDEADVRRFGDAVVCLHAGRVEEPGSSAVASDGG